ncbi:beta-lactamase superfamily domain-containing protein [Rhizoctonia solani AG-1 IA]|uniref:Beta-lactamase superfamily domain-containing protein n=1 Tax=Thanatephorus cucumeris (strain AG1-IA) TaxID=983506 RepID=L8WC34_THACA|nr:beta-lactamase superfamily domain-containing protein [Rhizoctonia solani AG-1 IA]
MTFIGTATAIISIDGVNFITDPVFDNVGTTYDLGILTLESLKAPALGLHEIPAIDAVLLSHEDHPDNLDTAGRTLLDGRLVVTTPDGANNLKPRPERSSTSQALHACIFQAARQLGLLFIPNHLV